MVSEFGLDVLPAGEAHLVAEMRSECRRAHLAGAELRRGIARQDPVLEFGHHQRGHRDLFAMQRRLPAGRRHHLDMVADQMFALARRIGAAADRHAEAGEQQDLDEAAQGGAIAFQQGRWIGDHLILEIGDEGEGCGAVGLPQKAAGEQPVGLCRRAADRIAEAGLDQAFRRSREDVEIDEHTIGQDRRQGFLVAMDGDRGIDGGIAVHRWRGGKDGAAFALPRGRILGEIANRPRAHGDIGAGFSALLHDAIRRLVVGVGAVAQSDRNRLAEGCERRLDPLTQRFMRVVVRKDRMRLGRSSACTSSASLPARDGRMTTDFTGTWRRSPVSESR